jgi:hypothetical protein
MLGLLLVPVARRDGESWTQRLPARLVGVIATAATVLVLASAMVWFGWALQIRNLTTAYADPASWTVLNPLERIIVLLLRSGPIVLEEIGNFGWLDTPLPTVAVLAWVAVAGVAVAAWSRGRSSLVPRWSVGAVLGLGYLVALLDEYMGGWGWQGRYLLPVTAAVCVFGVPGLMNGLERWAASRRLISWMLVVLMAVNALSVIWFLFRNVYGLTNLDLRRLPSVPLPASTPSWTPPLGSGVVLALVTLALACGIVAVWKLQTVEAATEATEATEATDAAMQLGGHRDST